MEEVEMYRRKLFEVKLRVLAELDILKKLIENDLYDLAEESFQRLRVLIGSKYDYNSLLGLIDTVERLESRGGRDE